jgi:hypothetical protein
LIDRPIELSGQNLIGFISADVVDPCPMNGDTVRGLGYRPTMRLPSIAGQVSTLGANRRLAENRPDMPVPLKPRNDRNVIDGQARDAIRVSWGGQTEPMVTPHILSTDELFAILGAVKSTVEAMNLLTVNLYTPLRHLDSAWHPSALRA